MSMHDDLKAYLDGELDSVRTDEVRSALDRDPILRRELSELENLQSSLKHHAAVFQPQGLEQTLAALSKRQKPVVEWRNRIGWASALAFAAIALGVYIIPRDKGLSTADEGMAVASSAKEASPIATAPSSGAVAMNSQSDVRAKQFAQIPADGVAKRVLKAHVFKSAAEAAKAPQSNARLRVTEPGVEHYANRPVQMSKSSVKSGTTAGENGVVVLKPQKASVISADPAPEVVALVFPSVEQGQQQVLDLVGKYRANKSGTPDESVTLTAEDAKNFITVDLPEDVAEKLVNDLKALPGHQAEAMAATANRKKTHIVASAPTAKAILNTAGIQGVNSGNPTKPLSEPRRPVAGRMAAKRSTPTSSPSRARGYSAGFSGAAMAKSRPQGGAASMEHDQAPGAGRSSSSVTLSAASEKPPKLKTRRIVIVLTELSKSKVKS